MATKKRKSSAKKRTTKRKVGAVRRRTVTHHASPRRRSTRRKVGGVSAISDNAELLVGAIGGAFLSRIVQKNIPPPKDSKATDYRPYAGLIMGAVAVAFAKKNKWMKGAGIGAIVEGSRALISDSMIPALTDSAKALDKSAKKNTNNDTVAGLPYTAGHHQVRMLNGKQQRRMNGGQNRGLMASPSPNSLAAVYDGM